MAADDSQLSNIQTTLLGTVVTEKQSLLEFPCDFPIKAIGRGDNLQEIVYSLVQLHVPNLSRDAFSIRPSGKGNYMAVTVIITAYSQDQLDAIYLDLTRCKQVIMAL